MEKNYSHLSAEERVVIMIERAKDASARVIARSLSTVTRELKCHRKGALACCLWWQQVGLPYMRWVYRLIP